MSGNRIRFLLLSLAFVVPLVGGGLVVASGGGLSGERDSLYKYLSVFTEVLSLVRDSYVEEIDLDGLMESAMEGSTDALGPFSLYVPAGDAARAREVLAAGQERKGLLLFRERGFVFAGGVEEGSVAEAAGVNRGDLVSRVGGDSTRELPLWRILERLDQEQVELELIRGGETHVVTLAPIQESVPSAELLWSGEIPLIRIRRFDGDTVSAVTAGLKELQTSGTERLVVDLVGVAVGDIEEAYRVAGLFVSGEVGTLQKRDGVVVERFQAQDQPLWTGRIAVAVDGGTLGAAEVLAAGLQALGNANLVGRSSYGHAGRRRLVTLSGGALLQLTDAFYTGPDGEPLDEGLTPDLLVEERSRTLDEREDSFDELIRHRAVELLLGETDEVQKAA